MGPVGPSEALGTARAFRALEIKETTMGSFTLILLVAWAIVARL